MCCVMFWGVVWNSAAIAACVNHAVSPSKRTSTRTPPSSVRYRRNSASRGKRSPASVIGRSPDAQALGRLADDLEVAEHRVLDHRIVQEAGLPVRGELLDLLDALHDVPEVDARVLPHSARASFRIRRRSSQ